LSVVQLTVAPLVVGVAVTSLIAGNVIAVVVVPVLPVDDAVISVWSGETTAVLDAVDVPAPSADITAK